MWLPTCATARPPAGEIMTRPAGGACGASSAGRGASRGGTGETRPGGGGPTDREVPLDVGAVPPERHQALLKAVRVDPVGLVPPEVGHVSGTGGRNQRHRPARGWNPHEFAAHGAKEQHRGAV